MKIRFNYREFLFGAFAFFLMIPFFKPQYFAATDSIFDVIYTYYLYISIAIIMVFYIAILISKREIPSPIMILIICYSTCLVLSSFLNGGYLTTAIKEGIAYIALFALAEMLLKQSIEMFISVVSPILNLLVIINLITMFLWPGGMYKAVLVSESVWHSSSNWFLGYDNGFIFYFLPVLMLSIIKNVCIKKTIVSKISLVVMLCVCIFPIMLRQQAASIVGMAIFLLAMILLLIKCMPRIITPKIYWYVYIAIFMALIVFRLQYLFSDFIEDVLGKNLTFTGRTYIWDLSWEAISQSPIFGYGIEDVYITVKRISVDSPHNLLLWIFYRGGLLQLLIFLVMIQLVMNNLQKNRDNLYVKVTAVALFSVFIVSLMEASREHSMFLMFIFAYYIGRVPLKQDSKIEIFKLSERRV